MTLEEKIDIISDKYARDIVMQRKEYPCLPLSKRMELTKFDGYEIAQAFEDGMKYADAHPHWISVDDELPKNRELVFITDCESADMGFYDYTDDAWQPFEKWLGNITHWMPLPAPPEHFADVSKKTSSSSEIPTNLKGGEK